MAIRYGSPKTWGFAINRAGVTVWRDGCRQTYILAFKGAIGWWHISREGRIFERVWAVRKQDRRNRVLD